MSFIHVGKIVEHPPPSSKNQNITFQNTTVVMQCLPANSHGPSSPIVAASPTDPPKTNGMRSPRSSRSLHRPASIEVQQSNGCTAITTAELKQRICDSKDDTQTTITQVPIDKREPFPPTPTTPFYLNLTTMGNKPSSTAGSPNPDSRTHHALSRSAKPVSRKSSSNIFKQRFDDLSPLPRDATASAMSVMHRNSHQKNAGANQDDQNADGVNHIGVARSNYHLPEITNQRFSKPSHAHSTSATTMTEARARRPLSPSSTVRDLRSHHADSSKLDEFSHDENDKRSRPSLRSAGLSPTLPAPSPLPEDSPRKYGLRDKMNTPELPENAVVIPKARRKSSGLEIFNVSCDDHSMTNRSLTTSRKQRVCSLQLPFLMV